MANSECHARININNQEKRARSNYGVIMYELPYKPDAFLSKNDPKRNVIDVDSLYEQGDLI